MLLIDGVKYKEWIPEGPHAEEEFEKLFKEHAQEIFGEQSLYFDIKQRLETELGIHTIPDGFVVSYGEPPQWRIIEAELSWHPLYDHIVNQIGRFISGIENTMTQRKIINAMDSELANNDFLRTKLKKAIGATEVYRFLSDLISQKPILTIIIEKETPELKKALGILNYPSIDVVEFQTFTREGLDLAVHAHSFSPLREGEKRDSGGGETGQGGEGRKKEGAKGGWVTFAELVKAGLLQDLQVLYFYHTRLFSDERAQVITLSNQLAYEGDGRTYSKSELAKILLIKHGFKRDEHGVAGPRYWKTEDGKLLRDLEEQVRSQRGDRR